MDQVGRALSSTVSRGSSGKMRDCLPSRIIDDLFARLHAALGPKFPDMFAGADLDVVRQEWGHYLADIKPVEMERGLEKLASRVFPPTLGEFRLWCRPCLDSEWAFHHAGKCLKQRDQGFVGDWSHPAVWRAAASMGHEVRSGDYSRVKRRWEVELDGELKKGWGEQVPPPPLGLSDQRKTRPPTEVERERIRAILDSAKGRIPVPPDFIESPRSLEGSDDVA